METLHSRARQILFTVLALFAANLACQAELHDTSPTASVTPSILPTATFTVPAGATATAPLAATSTDLPTAAPTDTPIPPTTEEVVAGPNLVITSVALDTTTPPLGGWVVVTVMIENQGGTLAAGFELVLIPHYGWGPPNPAGYETLPDLAPGATHAVTFTPGVLYSDAGTFTLRVLVTDDWYATGNPDSTGSGGDFQDHLITVGGS
ncbi:MAG: hypothetical protein JXB30_13490 [Anaerolineae bacterium]|nr:hypothetical protein [Anaerolineae bacterium]